MYNPLFPNTLMLVSPGLSLLVSLSITLLIIERIASDSILHKQTQLCNYHLS